MDHSLTALVALGAVGVYVAAFFHVGQMRSRHNIAAPATTGHPEFERAYRVQMNTLEQLVPFLLSLFLLSQFGWAWLANLLGIVWIAGRLMYHRAYMADPSSRSTGFLVSGVATLAMLAGALLSVLASFF